MDINYIKSIPISISTKTVYDCVLIRITLRLNTNSSSKGKGEKVIKKYQHSISSCFTNIDVGGLFYDTF